MEFIVDGEKVELIEAATTQSKNRIDAIYEIVGPRGNPNIGSFIIQSKSIDGSVVVDNLYDKHILNSIFRMRKWEEENNDSQ